MTHDDDVEVYPLLTDEERAALPGVVINRPQGSMLFAEGERTREVLLILKGHVKVTAGGPDRIVAIRGPGEVIGEMASLHGRPRSASVYAMEDILVQVVPEEDWRRFLYDNPRVLFALLNVVNSRLAESTMRSRVSWLGIEQRVAKTLLELGRALGKKEETGTVIRGLSQREIAGIVGASRESVAQVMRLFRQQGLVATGRGRITILDVDRLTGVGNPTPTEH